MPGRRRTGPSRRADRVREDPDPATRYGAVVFALDHAIGRVLEALEETGTANRTFVFFMSDNGAFRLGRQGLDVGVNTPLRQGGVTCWEGGLRVAAMARWPGRIEAGAVVSEPLWSPDLLTACARIAGAALPGEVRLDGRDPLPVLTEGAPSPHESFYFEYRSHAALRQGDWKIVRERPEQPWQLFDLAGDLPESNDLAERYPGRVAELEAEIQRWKNSF